LNPPTESKEPKETIKVAPVAVKKEKTAPSQVIDIKKRSAAESFIKVMKPKMPSILDPKTPQQIKAFDDIKKKAAAEKLDISEEMLKRFSISKEYNVDATVEIAKKYLVFAHPEFLNINFFQ